VRLRLRQRLEPNPFIWLALRDRLRFFGAWIVTTIMMGVAIAIYIASGGHPASMMAFSLAIMVIHCLMAAGSGATQLQIEQEQGTLELLLSTPLKMRDVLQGQLRATLRQMRGPVLLVTLLLLFEVFLIWT